MSIRRFLITNLLLTLAITLVFMSVGDFFFIKKDIQQELKVFNIASLQNNSHLAPLPQDNVNDIVQKLEKQMILDDILMLFIWFPISGIVTFFLIQRALNVFKKVAQEVANREPAYLESVELSGVPMEIQPLVHEINQLLFRLKEGFEREKRFAADAAHELRTPLAALKTQAQVALQAEDLETQKLALKQVIAGVDRSTHLVQQLLTFNRLAAQTETTAEMSAVPLYKLTAEIIANMAPLAINQQLDIELVSNDEKVMIEGNTKALNALIFNLVDNAIRYTPPGGAIVVSIDTHPDSVVLKVSDNGNGISEEFRSRLFERFFRVLGNDSPGSGLGFAIIEQAVRLHQAKINIQSPTSGQGLEVSIVFSKLIEEKS